MAPTTTPRTPPPGVQLPGRRFERANRVAEPPPPPAAEPLARRDGVFRRALVSADVLALAVALGAGALLGLELVLPGTLALVALALLLAKALGLYDRDALILRKTTLEEAPRLVALAAFTVLGAWLLESVVLGGPLRQGEAVAFWAVLLVALLATRTAARVLAQRGMSTERLLLLGDELAAERLTRALSGSEGAEVVALLPPERVVANGHVSVPALETVVRTLGVHRIVVSGHDRLPSDTLELFRAVKAVGVRLSFLPSVLATVGPRIAFDDVWGIPLIGVRRFGMTKAQRRAKRAFDLLGAGLILVLIAPWFALIALAIKRDSPGPVFFRQLRVGRDGALFSIYKFRTMGVDAEAQKAKLRERNEAAGGLFKIADDPRVTRVGRLLRKTSLDELPQLLNVVKGDMSLVGPRPLVVDEDEQIHGFDRRRLHLVPGMTGHWQILGSARVPLDEMVRIDYRYVAGWSLWEDAKILLRTLPYMLARRGM